MGEGDDSNFYLSLSSSFLGGYLQRQQAHPENEKGEILDHCFTVGQKDCSSSPEWHFFEWFLSASSEEVTPESACRQVRLQVVGSWEHPPQKREVPPHVMPVELSKERVWPEWRTGSGGAKGLRHLEVAISSL